MSRRDVDECLTMLHALETALRLHIPDDDDRWRLSTDLADLFTACRRLRTLTRRLATTRQRASCITAFTDVVQEFEHVDRHTRSASLLIDRLLPQWDSTS